MDTKTLRLVDIAGAYPGGIDALAYRIGFTRDQVWRTSVGTHLKPPLRILLAMQAELARSSTGRKLGAKKMDFLALWKQAREARLAYEASPDRPRRALRTG